MLILTLILSATLTLDKELRPKY